MENVESIIPIQKGSEEYLALFSGYFDWVIENQSIYSNIINRTYFFWIDIMSS